MHGRAFFLVVPHYITGTFLLPVNVLTTGLGGPKVSLSSRQTSEVIVGEYAIWSACQFIVLYGCLISDVIMNSVATVPSCA